MSGAAVAAMLMKAKPPVLVRTYQNAATSGTVSGTEVTPAGYQSMTVETWGAGQGGPNGTGGRPPFDIAGGAGGYSKSTISINLAGGQSYTYAAGHAGLGGNGTSAGGAPGGTSNSVGPGLTQMTCQGGGLGTGTSGGTATGGNQVNQTGGAGTTSGPGAAGGGNIFGYGGGLAANSNGGPGCVRFTYNP